MRKSLKVVLLFLLAILALGAIFAIHHFQVLSKQPSERLLPSNQNEATKMNAPKLSNQFETMDPLELPLKVPMSPEQVAYLKSIVDKMHEVINEERTLLEADPFFGKGEFFWPKDPRKPTHTSLSFEEENFGFKSISLGFTRENSDGPWRSAVLFVQPMNYPIGVFEMELSPSFFSSLTLQRSYVEKREHESITEVNVFEFRSNKSGKKTAWKFEARPDVSNLADKYPRSFHALTIKFDQ